MTKKTTIMVRNEQHSTNYMKQQPGASSRHDARHDSRHEHDTNTARSRHDSRYDQATITTRIRHNHNTITTPSRRDRQRSRHDRGTSCLIHVGCFNPYEYAKQNELAITNPKFIPDISLFIITVSYMQEKPYVDKDKLAIWGWVSESA